jgi:hypothetical protein
LTSAGGRPYYAGMRLAGAAAVLCLAACSGTEPARREMAPAREAAPAPAPRPAASRPEPAPAPPPTEGGHGIAARINNEIVTWKDVGDAVAKVKGPVSAELKRGTLRQIAEERLFLQAAKKNGVAVGDQELDDAIRRDIKTYGGEEEYERWLRLRNLTKTEAREEKRKTILIYKLYRHIIQKSFSQPDASTPGLLVDSVAPVEIAEYYEKNKEKFKAIENATFGRIALQFSSPREKEAKRAMAESIVRRLNEGADFAMLSIHYSDVRRAQEFADRQRTREQTAEFYAPETVALLFDELKVGETSGIVEDRNTINIFRLEQRIQQRAESLEEAEPRIRATIESRKREENRRKLRDHLVRDAYLWPADLFEDE